MVLLTLQMLSVVSMAAAAKTWFSFGDSYTQTGFNMTSGALPAVGNPLGNPIYPGYTSSGGENWVDYETTVYNTTTVLTYNVAYGGATINSTLVAPYDPSVLSLTDQVNSFLANINLVPSWNASTTLVSVWIGINDLGNSYYLGGDRAAFSDTLLDAYFALIEKLVIAAGARNFLFVNVPPTDRSPLMIGQSADAQALLKSTIAGFNTKLATRAQTLKSTHSGVQTWVWDANTSFNTILNNYASYGFTSITSYGDSPTMFWINDLHPTRYVHKVITQDLAKVLNGFV